MPSKIARRVEQFLFDFRPNEYAETFVLLVSELRGRQRQALVDALKRENKRPLGSYSQTVAATETHNATIEYWIGLRDWLKEHAPTKIKKVEGGLRILAGDVPLKDRDRIFEKVFIDEETNTTKYSKANKVLVRKDVSTIKAPRFRRSVSR